jgi:flagellar biosynthetic protein FliO
LTRNYTIGLLLFLATISAAQTASDSTAAVSPESIGMGWLLFKTIAILILIIGLIFVSVYLLKRYVFGGSTLAKDSEWIQILGQIQIQPKKFVTLVRVMNRVILVGSTDSSMDTLAEFGDAASLQPFLEKMKTGPGNWNEGKFLGLFRKNLES